MRESIVVIFFAMALPNLILAQTSNEKAYPKHEIIFGVGRAKAFGGVTSLIDVPFDAKVSPELALKAVYYQNINKNFSGGFHVYGYYQEVQITTTDSEGISSELHTELTSANVGVNGRWISRGEISPYGYLALSYVQGQLVTGELDSTDFYGVSLGGGVGISFGLGSHFSVSLEGIVSAGYANFLVRGSEFPLFGRWANASMAGVLVNISYLWGSL